MPANTMAMAGAYRTCFASRRRACASWRPDQATPPAYFSIDNGNTVLGTWNNHVAREISATGTRDSVSGGGPGPFGNDAFNDFSNPGVLNQITNTDLTLMHVLGWDAAQPLNVVIKGEMYFVASGSAVGRTIS